jgi:hypothetical protein
VARRRNIWSLAAFGAALALVSLFPSLVTLPADFLSLGSVPGGRLVTLLLLSAIVTWPLLLTARGEVHRQGIQLDRLVRFLSLHQAEGLEAVTPDSVLVVIPAYEEEENLGAVIPRIPETVHGRPARVLVVNDGSRDATAEVARELGALVVSHPFNRGGGCALATGYEVAQTLGPAAVVTIDADGQHDPEEIEGLVAPVLDDEADLVIGSRALGTSHGASMVRATGVRLFSAFITALTGVTITDCSSGFRAMRPDRFQKLRLEQRQYYAAEAILEAAKRGLRIQERPITITPRLSGESKKGPDFLYGLHFLLSILRTWRR